jgi:glycosyltransferase involved in cell wall biosynthesis
MLTALIATHNGTDTLGRTLHRFCALAAPPGGWKLLVVNNASTDGTEELVLGFRDKLPLEYLVEPRLGKPHALNTGLEHISGDLVVFADDDVLPDPDWLVAWRNAVDRNPEYAIFGGAIEPLFERDPPEWLSRVSHWGNLLFARTDPQPEGPVQPEGCIYGPNMAVRAAALASGIRFDERFQVGPTGLLGDELDFVYRLWMQGNKACFVPSARVRHIVQPNQFAWKWLLRRFYRQGKMLATFEAQRNVRRPAEIFRVPRWLLRRLATSIVTAPLVLLSCDSFQIFSHLQQIASDFGGIVQWRALHRDEMWRDLAVSRASGRSALSEPRSAG